MRTRVAWLGRGDGVDAHRSDDPLDRLYERYAPQVRRWARRLGGPGADVEDLIHDVFVVALRRRFIDRGEASVRTWLFRITEHVLRNRRRRALVRRLLLGRHQATLAAEAEAETPLEELERCRRHTRLYAELDRLSDKYRTTLILYELEGHSGEEVAELMGVNLSTVWVRLHRGRAKLLALLDDGERRS